MLKACFHKGQSGSQSSKWSCKSLYDLVKKSKIRVVSRFISATKSERKRIRAFPFSSGSAYDSITYDLVETKLLDCRKKKQKDKPITMHVPMLCD